MSAANSQNHLAHIIAAAVTYALNLHEKTNGTEAFAPIVPIALRLVSPPKVKKVPRKDYSSYRSAQDAIRAAMCDIFDRTGQSVTFCEIRMQLAAAPNYGGRAKQWSDATIRQVLCTHCREGYWSRIERGCYIPA